MISNKLSIENNRLTVISETVFKVLRRLKQLDLSHNLLSELHPQTFKGLPMIEQIK